MPSWRIFLFALIGVGATAAAPPDDELFVRQLYPALEAAQCRLCHSDNGVAASTRLHFPRAGATPEEIAAFGLSLAALVDRADPEQSLLFRKPTNRIQHTGGERIARGSDPERLLLEWIRRLAAVSEQEQKAAAARKVALARRLAARPTVLRRLTHSQYNNTVRDLLGDRTQPASQFPPEDFVHGFRNQLEGQGISLLQAEAYSLAAAKLARSAFLGGDRHGLLPCRPQSADDASCRARFVREFGRRAFRRPLTEEEAGAYERLFRTEAGRTQEFLKGAEIVVEAMLQSPNFLFLADYGPSSPWYGYANAARLAYLLWDTMPDQELLDEAARGGLRTAGQIEQAARRMLADPRARQAAEEFLSQWMRFDRLRTAVRDRRLYRQFTAELAAAMIEETTRLFHHLVFSDANFMEFFTARYSFLNSDLARLYDLPAPPEEFARVDFPPDSPRAGILGQALFHTLTSKPEETSPTERGLFVREHFLCQDVPPPPPGVNANLPPVTDERPMTNRDRLGVHLSSPACASCHRLIDPIGFGLERFDAIGRYREKQTLVIEPTRDEQQKGRKKQATEYHLEIDTSGVVAGIADSAFSSPRELGAILARTPACQKCVVKQYFRYAFGRQETPADEVAIENAFEAFRRSGFRFREIILSLVTSEVFRGGDS